MAPPQDDDTSADRDIRRLAVAIWVLAIAVVLHAGVTVAGYIFTGIGGLGFVSQVASPETTMPLPDLDRYDGFHDWPLDRQVATATVIVRTTQRTEGNERVDIVAEIIKQAPGVRFDHKVGDVLERAPIRPKLPAVEGWVQFYVGSPPRRVYGTSYRDGRIGLDTTLDQLRTLARSQL